MHHLVRPGRTKGSDCIQRETVLRWGNIPPLSDVLGLENNVLRMNSYSEGKDGFGHFGTWK
jgi:hypothetical protein